jgi:hypothetical protein
MCACEAHYKHDVSCSCMCQEHRYIRYHYIKLADYDANTR